MLGDFSGEIRIILTQYYTNMVDLKNNCTILDVEISNENGENLLDVKEVKQNFKNMLTKELVGADTVNGESLGKLGHIAMYLKTFRHEIDDVYKRLTDVDRMINKWKLHANITCRPSVKILTPIITRYKSYKAKLRAQVDSTTVDEHDKESKDSRGRPNCCHMMAFLIFMLFL